jgi:hypothetical protein
MTKAWNAFWFGPEPLINLTAARVVIVLNTLWILLSRPRLPDLVAWPAGFWSHIDPVVLRRFFIFAIGVRAEWVLYIALFIALIAAGFGIRRRAAFFIAGMLLYHFAPLEDIFSSDGPYFRGLGVPALAFLIFSFADASDVRWPLMLTKLLFVFTYLFSGIAKIFVPGVPTWISKQHFLLIVAGRSSPDAITPWSEFFFRHPALGPGAAALVLALDLSIIVMIFRPRTAWFFVPAAMTMHLLAPGFVGVIFLDAPLLLLFVDWNAAAQRFSKRLTSTKPSTQ